MIDFTQMEKLMVMGLAGMFAQGVLSMVFTRICIKVLPLFGLIDIPRGRHTHRQLLPRGGGISIILSFVCIAAAVLCFMDDAAADSSRLRFIIQLGPPVLLVGIMGIIDDKRDLSSVVKLIIQIFIALYFFFTGAGISHFLGYALPPWIGIPLTVAWVVLIINAFNLIDGMDGLAAGLASISSLSMGIWYIINGRPLLMTICMLVFCGSCLGFLKYNFSPAKIFMGDTGSLFIGLIFAYFSIKESVYCVTLTGLLVPVLGMGIPIYDVFLAIVRRLYRRYIEKRLSVRIMVGDHDHLHHRIQQSGKNQKKTAMYLYSLAIALVVGAIAAALISDLFQMLSYAVLMCVVFVMIRLGTIEFFDVTNLLSEHIKIRNKHYLLVAAHPVVDIVLMGLAYIAASQIYRGTSEAFPVELRRFLFCLAPFSVVLLLSGIYRTYWLRISVLNYFQLFKALFSASVIVLASGFVFVLFEYGKDAEQLTRMKQFMISYLLMGNFLIFAERFYLHFMDGFYVNKLKILNRQINKTVIYGGGQSCQVFLALDNYVSNCQWERNIIGIIDDNPSFRRLNIYGFRVLGTSDDLDDLEKEYSFNEIVIALQDIPEESRRKIENFGKKTGIRIIEFRYELIERQHTCS